MSNSEDLSRRYGWNNTVSAWKEPPAAANDDSLKTPAPLSSMELMTQRVLQAESARQTEELVEIYARERAKPTLWQMVCKLLTNNKKPKLPQQRPGSTIAERHRPRRRSF